MIKVPQTLAAETTEALNALIAESDRIRDWDSSEILTLRRAAEKLQKVDARQAFICLGSIAAICGNLEALHEHFQKALQLPDESQTKAEYFVSLANAGLYSKAHELGKWLLEPRRGFFPRTWERAVSVGLAREVWNRLSDAKRTFPELSDVDFSVVGAAAAVMQERQLSDHSIASVFDLMGEIQRTHGIMFAGSMISSLKVMRPPEDPPYLFLTISLDANVSEVQAMNRKLASLVVERLSGGAFPQGLVATFAKAFTARIRATA